MLCVVPSFLDKLYIWMNDFTILLITFLFSLSSSPHCSLFVFLWFFFSLPVFFSSCTNTMFCLLLLSSSLLIGRRQRWPIRAAAPSTWPRRTSTLKMPAILFWAVGGALTIWKPAQRWRGRDGSQHWSWPRPKPSEWWTISPVRAGTIWST